MSRRGPLTHTRRSRPQLSLNSDEAGFAWSRNTLCKILHRVNMVRRSSPTNARPSHISVHERSKYQMLSHFDTLQVGDRNRPWTATDLEAIPDLLDALGLSRCAESATRWQAGRA